MKNSLSLFFPPPTLIRHTLPVCKSAPKPEHHNLNGMIRIYTQPQPGQQWLDRYRGQRPIFACILGFTDTALIPGISAAGATPADRKYTAIADAEFLDNGPQPDPRYPLPPLHAGASPVLISRAIVAAQNIPVYLFNAGLPQPPSVPAIDLEGTPARCVTTGHALDIEIVKHLLDRGLDWGHKIATQCDRGYLIIGECVVGGTTTALALLTALGISATGMVNSSHPQCNHQQKLAVVKAGLQRAGCSPPSLSPALSKGSRFSPTLSPPPFPDPLHAIAAVGDPMQVVAAGMAIAASGTCGVLLAGGTQMLAVYALAAAIARHYSLPWCPDRIAVGTTRWVAEDPTGDTVGLANVVGPVPLLATQLSFAASRYPQLRIYEEGFVKEGVGAGACAIAAHLYQGWTQTQLLAAIEATALRYQLASR